MTTTPLSPLRWGRVLCATLCFCVLADIPTAHPQTPIKLECGDLTESSGVCVGSSEIIWTHNDSGGKPIIYGFTSSGRLVSRLTIQGADAIDWEDICSFRIGTESYLAIADVGDNTASRKHVAIYIVREPQIADTGRKLTLEATAACLGSLTVTYDSGPVNCESICYDSTKKTFVLPSKEPARCRLFEVDATKLVGDVSVTAKSTQSLFLPLATGADISRDGKRLVLCSYGPGWMLSRAEKSHKWNVAAPKLFKLPARRQGEAICFSIDAKHLLLTSEFAPTPLHTIDCPAP